MKRIIVLVALVLSLAALVAPALANPGETPGLRSTLAQQINNCRSMMRDMVSSGQMTPRLVNDCLKQMKNAECPRLSGVESAMCANQ